METSLCLSLSSSFQQPSYSVRSWDNSYITLEMPIFCNRVPAKAPLGSGESLHTLYTREPWTEFSALGFNLASQVLWDWGSESGWKISFFLSLSKTCN